MRRLIILITAISLIGLLVVIAADGSGRAQVVPPPPTPKGQLGGAVRLTTPPIAPPPFATATPAVSSIVGSWLVTSASAGTPPSLLTFGADNTLTGAAGDAHGASLHGAWSAHNNGSISLRAVWLVFAANGTYTSLIELTGTLHVDDSGNGWLGQFTEQELRTHGVSTPPGPVTLTGIRITVQPNPLNPPYLLTPAP